MSGPEANMSDTTTTCCCCCTVWFLVMLLCQVSNVNVIAAMQSSLASGSDHVIDLSSQNPKSRLHL